MPCLLYCIAELGAATTPGRGVRGAAIESSDYDGLRCYYSIVDTVAGNADALQRDALAFHRVTHTLFEQSAIIPFRFPTVLSSLAELAAYLRDQSGPYHAALNQFAGTVQLEIRITAMDSAKPDAGSGTDYLKSRAQRGRRLEHAISCCRVAISGEVIDWRQRESSYGVRCFVLVKREAVTSVQAQLQQVRLEQGVTAAISGPWPPTEFFPDFA